MSDYDDKVLEHWREAQRRYHAYMSARAEESRYPTRVSRAYQHWLDAQRDLAALASPDQLRRVLTDMVDASLSVANPFKRRR